MTPTPSIDFFLFPPKQFIPFASFEQKERDYHALEVLGVAHHQVHCMISQSKNRKRERIESIFWFLLVIMRKIACVSLHHNARRGRKKWIDFPPFLFCVPIPVIIIPIIITLGTN